MPSSIFLGVTTAPARDYVARCILARSWDRIYFPCAGRFGLAVAYLGAGGKPENVETSDIGLFSSIVGYLASGRALADLGIRFEIPLPDPPSLETDLDVAAQVMLALKLGQISAKSQHGLNHRAQLLRDWDRHHAAVKDQVLELVGAVDGVRYGIRDLWEVVEEAADNPGALLAVNVPTYKGGYGRMFARSGVAWAEPPIPEFDPGTYERLIQRLNGAACTALVYCQHSTDAIPTSWPRLFAQAYSKDRTDSIVCNQPLEAEPFAVPENQEREIRRFPIYNDEEITPDTQVRFVRVDAETCLYYRDLFVHKLGVTKAESYFLLLVDGKVVTAMGLNTQFLRRFQSDYIYEVFGISKSSERYKRLGKLFMLLLTSGQMRSYLETIFNFGVRKPSGIQTTSITTYAEGKTDRGVMKLVHRETLPDGRFRVVYRADFRPDTWADVVRLWLERFGGLKRR